MRIHRLPTGEAVHRYQKSIVICFERKVKVLSTAHLNGGYSEELKSVFNYDATQGAGMACKLRAETYQEHMKIITEELGLDADYTAGITTAASMENVAIKTVAYKNLSVTVIVTGGIEVNGGRVGDPTTWYEVNGKLHEIKEGTINIILYIDGNMPPETLTRALVTCTEAKTAAIQELLLGSMYSRGLATGSGTDGTILIANGESPNYYQFAGKHSKLGELIGLAVKPAVKEALFLQTGASPEQQFSILRRMQRFGIKLDTIWDQFKTGNDLAKPEFVCLLEKLDKEPELVVLTSLYVHLLDQFDWDLINMEQTVSEAKQILKRMNPQLAGFNGTDWQGVTKDGFIEAMTQKMTDCLVGLLEAQICIG
ncbi:MULTISPECIES: adenosylcobinamide amidohydrolase [unclassified Acetobacterium]|jgi:adenosylcobinamide amidohydrolase|nr:MULTISPECIES: adenosylcobinamide amidohydrolase [unclassified Acetobacterium]AWW28042.1 adenosylcobinamide amidohydrolase [Acetobacterium sp. KB-1]MDZ5726468.1 adenosylcobinamide amidohydrolase [Acetobacterium sp. K1/6]